MIHLDERLLQLHLQRGRLLERITTQRNTLAQQCNSVGRVLGLLHRLKQGLRGGVIYLLRHPGVTSAGLAALLLLKPRLVWRWGSRGLLVWRGWRAVRVLASKFL